MPVLKYLAAAALFLTSLHAVAQQNAPAVGSTPPKLERLEEGEAPAITIRKPDGGKKIIERRENGKVKQVEVRSGGSTYIVKPNEPAGTSVPGDAESDVTRPAQWKVLEFDLGHRKEKKEVDAEQVLQPAPPPPMPLSSSPAKK